MKAADCDDALIKRLLIPMTGSAKLKDCAKTFLEIESPVQYHEALREGFSKTCEYLYDDCWYTWSLDNLFQREIDELALNPIYDIERSFLGASLECEENGIQIDVVRMRDMERKNEDTLISSMRDLNSLVGHTVNPNSPKQIVKLLVNELGISLPVTKSGPSTSIDSLRCLKDILEFADGNERVVRILESLICAKRARATLMRLRELSRYIDPKTNRLHPYFKTIGGADTGRASSSCPNIQNIPKTEEFRSLLTATPGHRLICFDFSQNEPRVLAHFLHPSKFSELFFLPGDFYERMRDQIFKSQLTFDRGVLKAIVLAVFYGKSPTALADDLKVEVVTARKMLDDFFNAFPEIVAFRDAIVRQAAADGWVVGMLGRRRYLPDLLSADPYRRRGAVERFEINTIVQGGAATLFKFKVGELRRGLPAFARFLIHCHDELLFEVPETLAVDTFMAAKAILEAPVPWFSIPLKVEGGIGLSWFEAKTKTLNPSQGGVA